MSKKNILNTQINHKKLYANQLIPLDEYLYEDFVLLPELNNIGKNRVKRAGGDEEQAGEPAAKKPRTEPAPINMEVWSEEDRNVLLNIDPELISKFELLCSALRTNAESITQEYLAVIDQNINTLYGLVTGNEAKRQLYGQLEYLHYVVSTLPGTPLYMTPLPQMVPEVSTLATPTVFSASLRPSGWPDEDWNTLHIKFPNIVQMIKTLRRFVKHNKKITQNRLTAIDNILHEMLSSLSSELARSEVLAVLKELHQKLPLMNNPALRMRSLTGETVTPGEEGAVAPGGEEVVYHIKVNLNKWDEDDKQHIKTVIPDFEQQVKTIYNLSKKTTGNEQQEAATFYKNLSIAWEGLKSNPAKIHVFNVMKYILGHLNDDIVSAMDIPVLPQYGPKSLFSSSLRPSRWVKEDKDVADIIFPDMTNRIYALKRDINLELNISQERVTEVERKLRLILENLTSERAKYEIYNTLRELKDSLEFLVKVDLTMGELSTTHFSPEVIYRPELHFSQYIYPNQWLPNEIVAVNNIFPDMVKLLAVLRKDMTRYKNISDKRFRMFEEKLNEVWTHLKGEKATKEFRDMYRELANNISLFTSNRIQLKELTTLSAETWLMTDFMQREAGMTDTWLAEDKKLQENLAPSLMRDLRQLATKDNVSINDIDKLDEKLNKMLEGFQGVNAKATVKSIQDAMYNHFINKKNDVPKNIHILYSHAPENVYNEPLNVLNSMADSLTIWVDSINLKHKKLQGIIAKIVRIRFINDKISAIQSKEGPSSASQDSRHISLLEQYRDLMSQQTPDAIQRSLLLQSIKSERDLSRFIRSVELSLPLHTNQILNEKRDEWGDLLQPDQQKNLQQYVDKYKSLPISHLTREFLRYYSESHIVTELPGNLHVRELEEILKNNTIYQRLNAMYYTFDDRDTIVRYLLACEGMQGLFTSEYTPPLSDEVMSLLDQYLGENITRSAGLHHALIQSAESRLKNPDAPFSIIPPVSLSSEQAENFQMLSVILSLLPLEQWFRHPEWFVPVLSDSLRFSTDGKTLTDRAVIVSGGSNLIKDRSFLHYFEILFDIQQDAIHGKLTDEGLKQKLSQYGLSKYISEENIVNCIKTLSGNRWKSLTQVHSLLMGSDTLAHGLLMWNVERYPVLKCLFPYISEMRSTTTLLVNEESEGLKKRKETAQPETHKYTLLSWSDFYGNHATLWSELADTLHVTNKMFHPQSLLVTNEGRCMGLSLLYLNAVTPHQYDILTQNLLTAGALLQTSDSLKLPLTLQDNIYLNSTINIINKLQLHGNKLIQQRRLKKVLWKESNLAKHFNKHGASDLLVTTPAHSLLLQQRESLYRVTDTNFGHADFKNLSDAVRFLELSIQLTPIISEHYGVSGEYIQNVLSAYIIDKSSVSGLSESGGLLLDVYQTSQEKLSSRSETVIFADQQVTWKMLFDIGAYARGSRINEQSSVKDIAEMTIHGDILRNYLSSTVLNSEQAEKIKAILYATSIEPGTTPVIPDDIHAVPADISSFAFRVKKRTQRTMMKLSVVLESISDNFRKFGLNNPGSIVKISLENIDKGLFSIRVNTEKNGVQHFSVEAPGIVSQFRKTSQMFSGMSESGIFDFDLGMNVAGIVQYARILEQKAPEGDLTHFNAALDIKQLAESTLGSMIQIAGDRFFNHDGIQSFRLETWLANNLRKAATYTGKSVAQALNSCARFLELPVLEVIGGVWNLSSSVSELQQAKRHAEIMSARVRVAFDSISLSLTFASIAFPPLIVAAGPIAAIGMGAVSIAHNVASKEERHAQWLECQRFLDDGSRNVVTADPASGVLDFSGNHVLGNMYLDLRDKKPVLNGSPSFNSDQRIGNRPDMDDWQIRQRLGYGNTFMPASSLAKGYANTLWPKTLPSIPEGEYNTVIVGYGRQYRANTEIEYLSNKLAWREVIHNPESRYALPPLEMLNQQCTVICGKNNTMIIPVRVLSELTPERILYALGFINYKFVFLGGGGGITVQPGGAGIYKIDADMSAEKNILSFRGLPDSFNLSFDLSQENQTIAVDFDGKTIPVMEIYQRGINTIIGSLAGFNVIKGNSQNNTFYAGYGGGEIYSGGGSNKYIIPGKMTSPLTIYLEEDSDKNEIILLENNLEQINLTGTYLHLKDGENIQLKRNVSGENVGAEWIRIYTNDGFMLSSSGVQEQMTLVVSSCDTIRLTKCYPDKSWTPDNILNYLNEMGWKIDKEVVFRMKTMVARYMQSSKNIICELNSDVKEATFTGQSAYRTTIYGIEGGRYNLRSSNGMSVFCINLYGNANAPEIIDLRELISDMVKSERHDNHLILKVYCGENIVSILIENSDRASETWVYLSPDKKMKLRNIIDVTSNISQPVILYKEPDVVSVNKTLSVDDVREILTHVPSSSTLETITICFENPSWTEKKVSIHLLSGQLKKSKNKTMDLSDIRIRPFTKEYLFFTGKENVTFNGEVSIPPLVITSSGTVDIPRYRWQSVEHIIVLPSNDAPVIKLNDFSRYEISFNGDKNSSFLYPPELIKVSDRDLSIKLLYLHESQGVKTIEITLKNYFTDKIRDVSEPERLIATTPLLNSQLISRSYHWKLLYLAETPLSIIGLVSIRNIRNYRLKNNKPL
ncbi:cysteine protease domain, YopT-type [Escherichia coli]|uniref:DUF3491 domain-containing protein n=1 Tax=Escherichia coli TaxID=562 RepID=UPI000BB5D5E6|nr:DUF3491 domain-containing protein [Escherichia coli]EET4511095.1 DUF3491 domain-containing protein [Escherichia coli]EFH7345201.1 DUF3491 domain-containing protein [Escherichia coli]EHB7988093.1 DUF3491 domain-containing protein [Escherichia coli]ELX1763367.1 DUF3491 domain-containing protein [Escherichia coli]EMC3696996.1 DUF3491 domain-containing protein [Escherichia coli]